MKTSLILAFVLASTLALTVGSPALAGNNTNGFGLGLMLGEPSGLNAKLWTGSRTALGGGVAWSNQEHSGITANVDFVWHVHNMVDLDRDILPFYYGVGVRYRSLDDGEDIFGVRIPLGLNYLFAGSPFDLFFELAPVIDLAPEQDFDFNVVVGGRYFF